MGGEVSGSSSADWSLAVEPSLPRAAFFGRFLVPNRPVLVRGFATSWRAARAWSLEELTRRLGDEEVTITYSPDGLFDPNRNLARVPLDFQTMGFTAAARLIATKPTTGAYYIHERVMDRGFRKLRLDFGHIPYFPLFSGHYVPRIWIGGEGAASPLHYDAGDFNFLVHLRGRKQFELYSPEDGEALYPNLQGHLPHLSQVNHLRPDLVRFPRFTEARRVRFVLEAGDLLYVPSNWWHASLSLTTTISANFWFTFNRMSKAAVKIHAALFQSPHRVDPTAGRIPALPAQELGE